jgi:putative phosphoserine phosphatase/1-acylglycerol-3-phosphate O-acyltransferase
VKKKRSAAFFDVDGTLIYGDSQSLEAKFILKKKNPSLAYMGKILLTLFALQLNRGWISLAQQNKVYIKTYKGYTRQWLTKQAQDLFCQVIEKQFIPKSLALMHEHRNRGDLIVLVSATTHHLLIPFEKHLKPDKIFCTHLEFGKTGESTGRASGNICAQEEKQFVVLEFARDMEIDLDHSFAYSDHHSDIPLLESVGHPVAINPTKQLAACAKERGWPLYRF